MQKFLGISAQTDGNSFVGFGFRSDSGSRVLASNIEKGAASASILNNVNARIVDVGHSSVLMNVSAKTIRCGKNCLIYNVVDESNEGICLGDNEVLTGWSHFALNFPDMFKNMVSPFSRLAAHILGVYLPDGRNILMRSSMNVCGGKAWSEKLERNDYTFEDVYKINGDVDVQKVEDLCFVKHQGMIEYLAQCSMKSPHGDVLFSKFCENRLFANSQEFLAPAV